MNDTKNNTCAHHGCSCQATGDSKYCSAFCESAANDDATTIACGCGHSGCTGDIA